MKFPNIEYFIKNHITKRNTSLFVNDINDNRGKLEKESHGKTVLVIGGAGTIASSYIMALLPFKPRKLVVVDTNENGLTELTRKIRSNPNIYAPYEYITYPMNFGSNIFHKLLKFHNGFDIVANFAAHKHVRSEKDRFSVEAMIENNIFYAQDLLDILLQYKPKHFFCVSTDKAANPVNVMGASKKIMENVILSYSDKFKVTTARFANVAFSNGSLLDGLLFRLTQRQPISCPSDIKRFFVSPEESGQICLLSCILGNTGDIFFPKLLPNQMLSFRKIIEDFFEYLNIEIDYCFSEEEAKNKSLRLEDSIHRYPVYFFDTDTSGEKLYEEFYEDQDKLETNKFRSLGIILNQKKIEIEKVSGDIEKLKKLFKMATPSKVDIIKTISSILPEFNHIETGKSLDQKM